MELDEFIKATLVQMAQGVTMANDELEPSRTTEDGEKLPKLFLLQAGGQGNKAGVNFDIAVTTHTDSTKNGGGKVKLSVFEVDLSGKEGAAKQTFRGFNLGLT